MQIKIPIIPPWATHVAFLLIGIGIGGVFWYPRVTPIEPAAPAIALPGGAVVIKRDPIAPVPQPVKVAAKKMSGAKLMRSVSIDVAPKVDATKAAFNCEPLHLDLGLLRMSDDTQRIVATSTNGDIKNAVDIPIGQTNLLKPTKWSVGGVYYPKNGAEALFVDRQFAAVPIIIGGEIMRTAIDHEITLGVRFGIRF